MTRVWLLLALLAALSNAGWAQDPDTSFDEESKKLEEKALEEIKAEEVSQNFKETSNLIVMIRDQVGSAPSFGAGIIFGRDHERLYIATANHVVRRGAEQASAITVSLLFAPEKSFPAKLLDHFDASLDIGVIAIEGWTKTQIPGCHLPFYNRLSAPSDSQGERESAVFAIGNPNGDAWRPPSRDDLIHGDRHELRFRSAFLGPGYSGGGLLDGQGDLLGMIVRDEAPIGSAIPIDAVLSQVASWGYPLELRNREYGEPTPLQAAARHGDIEKLTAALSVVCADPNEAMFYAAESGQDEVVSSLLKAGISPNASRSRLTALHAAVENNHPGTVKLLLAAGANVDANAKDHQAPTPLHTAVEKNYPGTVKLLLSAGANVNAKDYRGQTPLDLVNPEGASPAVAQAQLEIVQALVEAGAKFGGDGSGWLPLSHALYAGNKEIAALLIRAGAHRSQEDALRTPLEIAVEVGSEDLVELLLAVGARADSRKLIRLAFQDHQEKNPNIPRPRSEAMVVTLLRAGAFGGIDEDGPYGAIHPLLQAVNLGWRDATRLLLERGPGISGINQAGYISSMEYMRPLELAIKKNDVEMVKLLLASGANVNVSNRVDSEGDPLHQAACHSKPPVLQLLLNAGAQINGRNVDQRTALDNAIYCKNTEAEQFLRQHGAIK